MSSSESQILVIRSAESYRVDRGAVGEVARTLTPRGHAETVALGSRLIDIAGGPLDLVRFAPAMRTAATAREVVAQTWSSVQMERDDMLTESDPEAISHHLARLPLQAGCRAVMFTHFDVIEAMVMGALGCEIDEDDVPTASVTRFVVNGRPKLVSLGRTVSL